MVTQHLTGISFHVPYHYYMNYFSILYFLPSFDEKFRLTPMQKQKKKKTNQNILKKMYVQKYTSFYFHRSSKTSTRFNLISTLTFDLIFNQSEERK